MLHADQEHTGLRVFVLFLLAIFLWVFFILARTAVNAWASAAAREFVVAISCGSSLVLGLGVTWALEQWLKKVWHSGRSLTIADNEISIREKKGGDLTFNLNQNFMRLNWYYHLQGFQQSGRERRLPKKWVCLACQVQQDENRFAVFAYMPPPKARPWIEEKMNQFRRLDPKALQEKNGRKKVGNLRLRLPKEVIAGKDGRHWLAEQRRWQKGFELTPSDFDAFMKHLMTFTH